jgi:hypothetical protein
LKSYKVWTTECFEKIFCTIKRVTGQLGLVCGTMFVLPSVVVVAVVVVVVVVAVAVGVAALIVVVK